MNRKTTAIQRRRIGAFASFSAFVLSLLTARMAYGIDIMIEESRTVPVEQKGDQMAQAIDRFVKRALYAKFEGPEKLEEHLREILAARVHLAASEHDLNPSSREKLHLAGMGDIQQFMQECQLAERWELTRGNLNQAVVPLRALQKRWVDGLHRQKSSLFQRRLFSSLTNQQHGEILQRKATLRENKRKADLMQFVVLLDREFPMDRSRRDEITAFLLKNIEMPEDQHPLPRSIESGEFFLSLVADMTPAKLDEFQTLFANGDWKKMEFMLARAKQRAELVRQVRIRPGN